MSKGRLAVSLALLGAVAGGYLYYERVILPAREQEERAAGHLFTLAAGAVNKIEIARPGGDHVALERKNNVWWITRPVDTRADADTVKRLLESAADTKSERGMDGPRLLEEYGLADPVRVTMASPGATETLSIGAQNPSGASYYALTEGARRPRLAPKSDLERLMPSLFDLRDKRLFSRGLEEVKSVKFTGGALNVEMVRDEAGGWRLIAPVGARADDAAAGAMIDAFMEARAAGFYGKPASLALYGLDNPMMAFTAVYDDGVEETLLVGAVTEGGQGRYAMRKGGQEVARVPLAVVEAVPASEMALRNRKLVSSDLNVYDINRLALWRKGAVAVELDRKRKAPDGPPDGQWTIVKPATALADAVEVDRFLRELTAIEAESFLPHDAMAGRDASPSLEIDLTSEGDTLRFTFFCPPREAQCWAMAPNSSWGLVIPRDSFAKLDAGWESFQDRRLFPLEAANVTRVIVTRLGQVFDVRVEGERWKLDKPQDADLDQLAFNRLVWTVLGLRAEGRLGRGAPRAVKNPITIAVHDKTGQVMTVIIRKERGVYLAQSAGKNESLVIPREFAEEHLIKALEGLLPAAAGQP